MCTTTQTSTHESKLGNAIAYTRTRTRTRAPAQKYMDAVSATRTFDVL